MQRYGDPEKCPNSVGDVICHILKEDRDCSTCALATPMKERFYRMAELDKELADWANLKEVIPQNVEDYDNAGFLSFVEPSEKRVPICNPFTQSMDSCIKYLVPHLGPRDFWEMKLVILNDEYCWTLRVYSKDFFQRHLARLCKEYSERSENMALAFCLTVQKMIKEGVRLS